MLLDKPVDEVTEADLQDLVNRKEAERKTIEYKQELPGGSDDQRKEFFADVSSFANASGGWLLYGIPATDGVPDQLSGIQIDNADGTKLALENAVRTGIQPRLAVATEAVKLASGLSVVIMHIPRSYAAPHMVTYKNTSRFFARTSNGKYQLDVGEIRAAFLRSETFADRVRAFRADRLAKIVTGETPYLLPDTAKLVLHIVPFGAFDPGAQFDLTPHVNSPTCWSVQPVGSPAASQRHNFDGLMRFGDDSYVQVFRDGCIEAVDAYILHPFEGKFQIPSSHLEHRVVTALGTYLTLQQQLGVELPLLVMLSLVGVRGYAMAVRENLVSVGHTYTIDRDALVVPEELVESYDRAPEDILKRAFDAVWNATGWSRSMNYDDAGNWLLR